VIHLNRIKNLIETLKKRVTKLKFWRKWRPKHN